MQHVLAQVGPYLCNVIPGRREWQPCRFFLHSFWGLFAPLGIRLQSKNGGNRFFPFRTMGLTSCTLQGYWFGLIVAVLQGVLCQNPHRTEHIIGVQAVWSLLEADDCKKHLCLRTNVKKAENGRDWCPWHNISKVIWDIGCVTAIAAEGARSEEQGMSRCGLNKRVCRQCSRVTTKVGRDHCRKPRMVKWASVMWSWEKKKKN